MAEIEKGLLPTWLELRKGLVLSAICTVLLAPLAYIIREVLDELGWLDGVANAIARHVMNISPALAGWLFALALAVTLQAFIVRLLRAKPKHIHHKEPQATTAPEASLQRDFIPGPTSQRQPVLYVLTSPERAPTRAVGDGTLVIFMLDVWANGFGFTRKTKSYSESRNPQIDWKGGIPLLQKCVITNYGPEPLTEIHLIVFGEIREVLTKGSSTQSGDVIMSGQLEMRLDKLDPGEDRSFTFYIQNASPFAVILKLEDADARSIGSDQMTRVQVDTNAAARLIALFQATT